MDSSSAHAHFNGAAHQLMNKVNAYTQLRETLQSRLEPRYMRAIAVFYWRSLLMIAFISLLAMLVGSFFELQASRAVLDRLNEPPRNQTPIVTRKEIEDTAARLTARQSAYTQLKSAPPSIADPSQ